jgi:hypothetical protein
MGSGSDAEVIERINRYAGRTDGRERLTARLGKLAGGLRKGSVRVPGFGGLVPAVKDGQPTVAYQPNYDFLTALINRYAFHASEKNNAYKYTKLDDMFSAIAQVLSEGPQNMTDEVHSVTLEGFGAFVASRTGGKMEECHYAPGGPIYLAGDLQFEFVAAPALLASLSLGADGFRGPPRGVALVEQVIAALSKKKRGKKPVPVPAAALMKLTLPGKRPLPPSLRAWLAYDGAALRLLVDPKKPKFRATRLADLAAEELGASRGFEEAASALPGDCILLPGGGSDSRQFIYLGTPDAEGEYPVFTIDQDDTPWVGLDYPGFDVWLAAKHGVVDDRDAYGCFFDDLLWGPAMRAQAALNLDGRRWIES